MRAASHCCGRGVHEYFVYLLVRRGGHTAARLVIIKMCGAPVSVEDSGKVLLNGRRRCSRGRCWSARVHTVSRRQVQRSRHWPRGLSRRDSSWGHRMMLNASTTPISASHRIEMGLPWMMDNNLLFSSTKPVITVESMGVRPRRRQP
ncbi:hypothetical protein ACLOJK_011202 [Asimina triloba]